MSSAYKDILVAENVFFSYSAGGLIEGLDLKVDEGEFIGILGPNGSGKSTILKLLSGILKPEKGNVMLWGKPIASFRNRDRAKLISYLPQMLDMGVPFSVGELVGMGHYPYGSAEGMSAEDAMGMVGLIGKKNSLITELSGGERRRAYIAMTLLQGAGILLLDEPLANLDIRFQVEIMGLLRELNRKRGISIVMALHDINLSLGFDRLALVKEGKVLFSGPPAGVFNESLLKEAFDIEMKVIQNGKASYITYGERCDST